MKFLLVDYPLLGFGIGTTELLIFMAVLLLLFGSAKLPSLMRNMGRSVNEFKAGIKEKPKYDPLDDEPNDSPRRLNEEYSETK